MAVLAAGAVDWHALWEVVVASLLAGVGVTFCFSLAVGGAARFAEMRRNDRPTAATLYAVLGLVGLAATAVSVALAIVVMTSKG